MDFRDGSAPSILFKQETREVHQETAHGKRCRHSRNGTESARRGDFWTTSHAGFDKFLFANVFGTLVKSDANDPPVLITEKQARILSPSECALLQGFPADWGKIDAIDESEFPFWREVWNEYARVFEKKRRSDKQVRSWMASPYREAAEYAMWGNGVALPCVRYILDNIAEILRKES